MRASLDELRRAGKPEANPLQGAHGPGCARQWQGFALTNESTRAGRGTTRRVKISPDLLL